MSWNPCLYCPSKWWPWETVLLGQWHGHYLPVCLFLRSPSETIYKQRRNQSIPKMISGKHLQRGKSVAPPLAHTERLRSGTVPLLVVLGWEQLADCRPISRASQHWESEHLGSLCCKPGSAHRIQVSGKLRIPKWERFKVIFVTLDM